MNVQNVIDCLQSVAIVILAIAHRSNRKSFCGDSVSSKSSGDSSCQTIYVQTTIREDAVEDTRSDSCRDRDRARESASMAAHRFALQCIRGDIRDDSSLSAGASNE